MTGLALALAVATSTVACVGSAADENTGTIGMELQIAPGVTINTVNWTISNATSGFNKTGSVTVRFSNTISFQAGAIPAGTGYTITLSATSVDGAFTCTGSAGFDITAGATSLVSLTLNCSTAPPGQGTVVVGGNTQICANLDSISASPLETEVNTPISLAATGSAGSVPVSFSWMASAGSFDNALIANPVFTCPATPGPVTITVTVSPSSATCNTVSSQTVTVTCDTLNPTFTNVYASIIGVRCIGCHRPGGGGVTVGMLDMSTQAAAYTNLVNVNAAGIGAGTSGITCASVMPPLVRVTPSDSANSLLFNKVHSKLVATPAPCGSPMPLPATAVPLKQAEVDLIAAWIDAGAMNN
ncbi:MAG TPA: hypothetical protein VLM79_16355 [Kofleriaceae bacterium]|nr:hypothetical protein [Kofleriaceae bacterium]